MIAGCPRELIGSCLGAKSLRTGSSPVPGGSPLLSQTASMCDCVNYVFLNKTIQKYFAAGGAWSIVKAGSHLHVGPGFPRGPGHNSANKEE